MQKFSGEGGHSLPKPQPARHLRRLDLRAYTVLKLNVTPPKKPSFGLAISVSIGIIKCFAVSTVTTRVRMLSFGIDAAPRPFATRLLPCRWYVVRSQSRTPLFRCVKSLLLLWKPHSWFEANLKTFYHSLWIRSLSAKNNHAFLSRVSILMRDIDIANLSVCLSVCNFPVSDENGLTYRHSFFFTIR